MTAATSPNGSVSPSELHEAATSSTGPVGLKAVSPSSSTGNGSSEAAKERGTRAPEAGEDSHESYANRFKADLAHCLVSLRQQRGWSVYDLERRTGISRSTLSRIERAVTEPTTTVLVRVCLAYGRPASRLLAEVESRLPPTGSSSVSPRQEPS
ncbi:MULTISPECIES: helix-turn-helix domain-containing protein [unclassified Streptomyces]|uniref:helix-turn-helix domain-containing protein n=1 Tax=unclassified Streptomyces TaxID=2593676 RepID=UPI002E0DC932|nr:helix-turn-helix domain-containing protein [Streptomyces sp. NBC_01334]